MSILSIIGRLNEQTQSYSVRVDGNKPDITQSDVAHAMKGLKGIESAIIYAYAGQVSPRRTIELWFATLGDKKGWNQAAKSQVSTMAVIAMDAVLPDRVCGECKGRRTTPDPCNHLVSIDCQHCNGKGSVKMTRVDKCKMLGVAESSYWRTWQDRLAYLVGRYTKAESLAFRKMAESLR